MIQKNPSLADNLISGDARMIDVLGVLMGIDMQGFSREEGSDELPPGFKKADPEPASSTPTPQPTASTSTPKPATPPKEEPKHEEEDVEMEDEDATAKKEAVELKAKGNAAYKARDFAAAADFFQKAWDRWPKDMTFLTNLGGEILVHDQF